MKTIIIALALTSTLAGCASPKLVHFAEAPRHEQPRATVMNAMIVDVAEEVTEQQAVTLDAMPQEDQQAIASPERAHAYAESFTLHPHQPMAFSFHCVSGEESLGCNAKPASE
jgi:hypothetical protein